MHRAGASQVYKVTVLLASSVLFSWYCQYRFTGPGRTVPCPPGPVLDFQWLVFEKVELETTIINDFEMTQKLSNMNSLVLGRDFCPLIWHGARFLVKFGHLNSLITVVTLRNFPPHQKFLIGSRCPSLSSRLNCLIILERRVTPGFTLAPPDTAVLSYSVGRTNSFLLSLVL